MTLRNKLIHLAHTNPQLRSDLLPLLRQAEDTKPQPSYTAALFKKDFLDPMTRAWKDFYTDRRDNLTDAYQEAVETTKKLNGWMTKFNETMNKYENGLQLVDLRFALFTLIEIAKAYEDAVNAERQREPALTSPRKKHLFDLRREAQAALLSTISSAEALYLKFKKIL